MKTIELVNDKLKNWNLLSKYVLMCLLIPRSYIFAAFGTSSPWIFGFSQKKWARNLETVVNRLSKAVKFLFLDLLKHYSPDIYILKVNNKINTRKKSSCLKWSRQTPERRVVLAPLLLTLNILCTFFLVCQLLILNTFLLTGTEREIWWPAL